MALSGIQEEKKTGRTYQPAQHRGGPPRDFGEQGKKDFISGEQGNKGQILRGNRGRKTILGNREHKKTNFRFWGNRGTSQFI